MTGNPSPLLSFVGSQMIMVRSSNSPTSSHDVCPLPVHNTDTTTENGRPF